MTARFVFAVSIAVTTAFTCFALADAPDAGAPVAKKTDATKDAGISKIPPDPPAMRERMQWVFDLKYDKGDLYLLGTRKIDQGTPQETPRAMGRFAIELFEGPTLIERVRFDFPFLGADMAPDAGYKTPPRLEPKLTTRIGVLFPATSRGTRLELWDRATDQRWPLRWPPEEHTASAASSSSSDAGDTKK